MMKRLVWLIPLTLLLVGVLSFAYTRNTSAAAKPASPALQMLSANYPATSLTANPDGYTTVETINFSVGSTAKLQVVSDNVVLQSGSTHGGPTCQINLDGSTLYTTVVSSGFSGQAVQDATITDSSVASGAHTLTIACNPNLDVSGAASAWGSVSAIVSTGL